MNTDLNFRIIINVLNNWLVWPPFLFIVGSHLLFGIPFTFMKRHCSNFKVALLIEITFYGRISSESVAPMWFSDVVHNTKCWILKTEVKNKTRQNKKQNKNLKIYKFHLKLKNFTLWGWMVFQTESLNPKAEQKWGTNNGNNLGH